MSTKCLCLLIEAAINQSTFSSDVLTSGAMARTTVSFLTSNSVEPLDMLDFHWKKNQRAI